MFQRFKILRTSILAFGVLLLALPQSHASDSNLNDFKYFIGGGGTNYVNWNNQAPGLGNFFITDISTQNQGDAYDNGGIIGVCTTSAAQCAGGSITNYSAAGTADLANNLYTGALSTNLNGLDVSATIKFSTSIAAARELVKLTNTSGLVVTKTISLYTDLGCDSNCKLYYEQSHGASVGPYGGSPATNYQTNSFWTITGDNSPSSDPPTSFVFGTSGAIVSPTTYLSGGIIQTYFDVSVPSNSTKYLMFILGIAGINTTVHTLPEAYAGVSSNITSYTSLPTEFKSDLSGITGNIINWSIGPFTSTTSIALAANSFVANKRNSIQITATVDRPGRVTFKYKGQQIAGCINVVAISTSAICNWKPIIQGQQVVTATLVPDDGSYSGSNASVIVNVGKRTGAR